MKQDPLFQRAMKFLHQFQNKNKSTTISNLYVLQTVDEHGTVTSEHYGINIMTNYGMTRYFTNNDNFPQNVYIGNGSGSIVYTNNTLNSPITTIAATIQSSTPVYDYPLYYDSIGGVVTTVMKYRDVYFDYNITDITGPIEISEYGIGTAWNQLWTHSWVYNSLGQRSTVVKNVNERLNIAVYLCMSYPVSLITTGWDNGKYICITNQSRFFNRVSSVTMAESNTYTFKRKSYYNRQKTHTISSFVNNKYEITTNMTEFILSDSTDSANGYVDGFISWHNGMNMFDRVLLDTAESFNVIGKPISDVFDTIAGFAESFGVDGYGIPFTQADVTASYTYNRTTGQYDCPDNFANDARKWYTDMSFDINFKTKLMYTNNLEYQPIYVYRNMNTADPIVAIDGETTTLYATNTYWDKSSWVRISDMSSVPAAVQNARFWLSGHADIPLKPVRSLQPFEFLDSNDQPGSKTLFDNIPIGYQFSTSDDIYGQWYTLGGDVYIITRGNITITPSGKTLAIGYNKYILSYGNDGNFAVTNIAASIISPTGDIVANIASIGSLDACHVSESHTGYVIFKVQGDNSYCVKVNLTGQNGIVQTQLQSTIDASCIYNNATYYVCIESSDTRRVVIRKLSDDSEYKYFSIPSNKNVPVFVYGFNNYVYATDGSTYGYVFDITGANDSAIETTGFSANFGSFTKISGVDDMIIVYSSSSPGSTAYAYLMESSNPSVVKQLNGIPHGGSFHLGMKLNLFKINGNTYILEKESKYVSGGMSTCISHYMIDLGKYLHDDVVEPIARGNAVEYNIIGMGEYAISENTIFPAANMIPHRLVGTTNCVSTHYRRKHISGKTWSLEVTNIASYDGKPPGNVQ